MKRAIEAIKSESMGYMKASKTYNVPKSTLERRVKDINKIAKCERKGLGSKMNVFCHETESTLVKYILESEQKFFGLSINDLRRMAFQLAKRNGLHCPFNTENEMAGKEWARGFLQRHGEISVRKPELTSAARARGFNKVVIDNFFDELETLQDHHHFEANRIFNVDETGVSTVPCSTSRVLAEKGKRQVGKLSSGERGQTITAVMCMSAAGQHIPPMLIFPRIRMKPELMDEAPPGSIAGCSPNGWITVELFTIWFRHFVKNVGASKNNPCLLVMDGHTTHSRNIDVIDLAMEHGVTILVLPAHCTHKLQPLDRSFMKPLKTYYSQECDKWLRNHPGRLISMFQIAKLLGNAFIRSATASVAIKGFRACGVFPVNRHVFEDHEFAPSTVTSKENQNPGSIAIPHAPTDCNEEKVIASTSSALLENAGENNELSSPGNNEELSSQEQAPVTRTESATPGLASPYDIEPIPKAITAQKRKYRRNIPATTVITNESYRTLLSENSKEKLKKDKVREPKVKRRIASSNSCATTSADANCACIYCEDFYSNSTAGEEWIKCDRCSAWAHVLCTNALETDTSFICEFCLPTVKYT